MPRRNKRKTTAKEHHRRAPSPYSKGYKPECCGCAFVGYGSVCLTSDGKCLKGGLKVTEGDSAFSPTKSVGENGAESALEACADSKRAALVRRVL